MKTLSEVAGTPESPLRSWFLIWTIVKNKGRNWEWTILLDTFNNEIIAHKATPVTGSNEPYYYCLPDKYQVFYSVRWFETSEENRRIDSESDFLIFDPSFGFLALEVKGGEGIEVIDGTWYLDETYENGDRGRRELKCSPYIQAEKSMRHFHDYTLPLIRTLLFVMLSEHTSVESLGTSPITSI